MRSVPVKDNDGYAEVVIGRSGEMRLLHPNTHSVLMSANIPYGARLFCKPGSLIEKDTKIAEWDPFNAVILSEVTGKVQFDGIIEGVTYRVESDEQTGYHDKIVVDSHDKKVRPIIKIVDKDGAELKSYDMPVGAHIVIEDGEKIAAGDIMVKIPRAFGKAGDITGGLPRVTELFEARNPSDPAIVSEIDGVVSFGKKLKRGNREIIITSKTGEEKHYLVPTSRQILAQENDFVKACTPLSEGAIAPVDILRIKGQTKVQEYIVNEVQEVYRLQGVKINDKHFEVIVRQMMRRVLVIDPGDTNFLEGELVDKNDFRDENDNIWDKKVVEDAGDSAMLENTASKADSNVVNVGQIITARKLRDINSLLTRKDLKLVVARDARPATAEQKLDGITRAALNNSSWISSASFQETTKILTEASINAKCDYLVGMKENVVVGHHIPAGTGLQEYDNIIVSSKEEHDAFQASKRKGSPHRFSHPSGTAGRRCQCRKGFLPSYGRKTRDPDHGRIPRRSQCQSGRQEDPSGTVKGFSGGTPLRKRKTGHFPERSQRLCPV